MSKNAGSPRSTENLLQVAGFLKQADKLVRDRNYQLALEQIAKARAKDPMNSYAEAYEQRVQLLLAALNEKKPTCPSSKNLDLVTPQSFTQHLGSIADLAIQEAHRTANLTMQLQALDIRHGDTQINASNNFLRAPTNEGPKLESSEAQIHRCISSAEELLHQRRLDEALNTLAPAILLDPLNEAILDLERKIRDTQEEDWMVRSRQYQNDENAARRVRDDKYAEIQKCILQATYLADKKKFSEALMILGQGYLLDPFNVNLATCEKMVLGAIGKETFIQEHQSARTEQMRLEAQSGPSEMKQTICRYLDKALHYLDEDRFIESLSQVAFAIIAAQNKHSSEEHMQSDHGCMDDAHRGIMHSDNGSSAEHKDANDVSRRIFTLMDKAKRFVSQDEIESALEQLLQASFLIPTDGSLERLGSDIARTFIEYYQLLRSGRMLRSTQDRSTTVPDPSVPLGDANLKKHEESLIGRSQAIVQGAEYPSHSIDRRIDDEESVNTTPEDRIPRMREHLLRCLRHLNNMKLIEASVEAELASLTDDSRKDVGSFAQTVAGLSRKAKAQIPLDALSETYDSIRQKGKDLVHTLWYEEMLNGIDLGLELLPKSDILLRRREEVAQTLEESKRTLILDQGVKRDAREFSKSNSSSTRKFKKRSFNQMGLSFSGDLDLNEETDESRTDKDSDATGMLSVQKAMRRASQTPSGSAYLGN